MKKRNIAIFIHIIFLYLAVSCAHKNPPSKNSKISQDTTLFYFPGHIIYNSKLDEISGIVMSRNFSEALWVHNDSGDKSRIFLINTRGKTLATFPLPKIKTRDLEDIALGPGPQDKINYIYLGDIGDNWAIYSNKIIYRFPEPSKYIDKKDNPILDIEKITFRLPDTKRDMETLMIDPLSKDIYIISKWEENVHIYKLPYPQSTKEVITAQKVGILPFSKINAGDISSDGLEILIKDYSNIYYWKRLKNEKIESTLKRKPIRLPYIYEPQGEAIAWRVDGSGYYTVSETADNTHSNLFFYF